MRATRALLVALLTTLVSLSALLVWFTAAEAEGLPACPSLRYPVVLVAGTLGSWSSERFQSFLHRAGEPYFAYEAEGLASLRAHAAGEPGTNTPAFVSAALAVGSWRLSQDGAKPPAERRHIVDYEGTGLYHQAPERWVLDPMTAAYAPFLDLLCAPAPRGLGLTLWSDVFVFCWDGVFTSVEANAAYLARFIQSVVAQTGAEGVQVVAHSQGGIVAAECVEQGAVNQLIRNLVLVGAPMHGAAVVDTVSTAGAYPYVAPPVAAGSPIHRAALAVDALTEWVLMNGALWCVADGGPTDRLAVIAGMGAQFAAVGQTAPLAAMRTTATTGGGPGCQVPRVTTVISTGHPTPVATTPGAARVSLDGDGTVTDSESMAPELASSLYSHIRVSSRAIAHRCYFQSRANLDTWVWDAIDFQGAERSGRRRR